MSSLELVTRFCLNWPGLSPAEIAAFFTDDCVYDHVSIDRPLVGPRAIAGAVEIYRARFEQIESEVVHISDDAGVVLCERIEKLWLPGGRQFGFQAMATVQVRDGKISRWHDYFDVAALKRQVDVTEG